MKKQIITKIISGVIIFTFVFSFLQIILPTTVNAASQIDWEKPNKSGKTYDKYKFKITDVVNSDVAMQVVGCTGVVNRVSVLMDRIGKKKITNKALQVILDQAKKQCVAGEKIIITAAGVTPEINDGTTGVDKGIDCKEITETKDGEALRLKTQEMAATQAKDNLEGCFNGIATTLAKNQLTALTRSAVSWINTGFSGNPLYVQNITSLTTGIERNVLETGIDQLTNQNSAYPYGTAFSQSVIRGYRSGGLFNSGTNALNNLTSDLSFFITDPNSYYTVNDERTTMQRAQDANIAFSNDFSTGGWDGWLAFTQRDQNNPLGFTMRASQYLADDINSQTTNTKAEVLQNNGFLSQKRCTMYQIFDKNGVAKTNDVPYSELAAGTPDRMGKLPGVVQIYSEPYIDPDLGEMPGQDAITVLQYNVYQKNKTDSGFDVCVDKEIVTPGSLIKDQMSAYITSPVRQLELADTINESLNAVFSILLSKLQSNGLSGLSSEQYIYDEQNMDWTNSTNGSLGGSSVYNNNGAYSSGFDLTRDLGNTYIYDNPVKLGTWNANENINLTNTNQSLYPDLAPVNYSSQNNGSDLDNNVNQTSNVYYTVANPGKTKIILNGYNGWALGDRAFWNGSEWQNWKKDQANPIKKRGVIQVQKDYIVAATESLQFLPNVMPKLGELDYCIPGPNPNYKSNVGDNESLYTDWVGTMVGTYNQGGFLERDSTKFTISRPGDKEYEAWKNIFKDNPKVWSWLAKGQEDDKNKPHLYYGWPLGLNTGNEIHNNNEEGKIQTWVDNYLYMVNNYMFNNFYEVFDKMMNTTYFSNMTREYNETEDSTTRTLNSSYIPMAEEGLSLTRDIVAYDEDITAVMNQYRSDISQAKANIGKLEAIKKQVSIIIKTAQDRRDANLVKILEEETKRKCLAESDDCMNRINVSSEVNQDDLGEYCLAKRIACEKDIMTEAEYKTEYAECLEEEDILYYDESDIMNDSVGERCNNNLDDDLDGLIDRKDPDCQKTTIIEAHCESNPNYQTSKVIYGSSIKSCKEQDNTAKLAGATESQRKTACSQYSHYQPNNGTDPSPDPYLIYDCTWVLEKTITN
jgi:hypothetical protein